MRRLDATLAAAAARLVFVGTGSVAMAADFGRTHGGGHPVLSDSARRAFQAAGMRRSLWAALHWRAWINLLRALRRGHRQGRVQGDPWQQGGVLVFAGDGRLVHAHIDVAAGDEVDLQALAAAVRAAAAP